MDVNILSFGPGEGIEPHVNETLDVWLVVIRGTGDAWINDEHHDLAPGTCLYLPAGCRRAIRSTADPLLYASAHPKRPGLMPQ
ncbi:MAG: cupin domain-containing protein [Ardenticatenales bacterium]|nr:cupin domain-containing protein [Ardenticatenales bacterium]